MVWRPLPLPVSIPSGPVLPPWTAWQRRAVVLVGATALLLTAALIVYPAVVPPVIDAVYEQRAWPALHRLVPHPPRHPVEHYYLKGRQLCTRGAILLLACEAALLALVFRRQVAAFLRGFVSTAEAPLNLAVFRIVFFGTLLVLVEGDRAVLLVFSEMPQELRVTPGLLVAPLNLVSFSPAQTLFAIDALRLACLAGMVGLCSRSAAWAAFLLGFYLLGIPQCFGKVNHYHHLIWFAALLGASRCGDVLAVDAVIAAWRRASQGLVAAPGPAPAYGTPLRFVWLLLGVIYFFAGFWKWFESGLDWALSDNLRHTMHDQWRQLGGWRPPFPVDEYPLLYRLAGLGTLVFEVAFIALILSRRTRWLAAILGMAFHIGTFWCLRISFWCLQTMYVAFVDWARLGAWLGRRLFPDVLHVSYARDHVGQRRAAAIFASLDLFQRVHFVACGGTGALRAELPRRTWTGPAAWCAVARRSPAFWLLVPLFALAATVYRSRLLLGQRVASGVIDIDQPPAVAGQRAPAPAMAPAGRPLVWLGTALVMLNCLFGALCVEKAWPLACYPTFCHMVGPGGERLEVTLARRGAAPQILDEGAIRQQMRPERWSALIRRIVSWPDRAEQQNKARALWLFLEEKGLCPPGERFSIQAVTCPIEPHQPPSIRLLLSVSRDTPNQHARAVRLGYQ